MRGRRFFFPLFFFPFSTFIAMLLYSREIKKVPFFFFSFFSSCQLLSHSSESGLPLIERGANIDGVPPPPLFFFFFLFFPLSRKCFLWEEEAPSLPLLPLFFSFFSPLAGGIAFLEAVTKDQRALFPFPFLPFFFLFPLLPGGAPLRPDV